MQQHNFQKIQLAKHLLYAFLINAAIPDPVQAPVPGIATNKNSPKVLYFLIFESFFLI